MAEEKSNSTGLGTWFRKRQEQEDERNHQREMLEEEREHEREMFELKNRSADRRKLIILIGGFVFLVLMILGGIAGVTSYFKLTPEGFQSGASPTKIEEPAQIPSID